MKITLSAIRSALMSASKWLAGLLAVIAMYFFATRASRQEDKAKRAREKYVEAASDTIDDRWVEAQRHEQKHRVAQYKAKEAKTKARKVRDAVRSDDSNLDDLFTEYQSRRVSDKSQSS